MVTNYVATNVTASIGSFASYLDNVNVALMMVLSAAGGVVFVWLARLMLYGIRTLVAARREQRRRAGEHALRQTEREDPPAPSPRGDQRDDR